MKTEPQVTKKRTIHSREELRALAAADIRPRTTLSFYRYVTIQDVEEFRKRLYAAFSGFDCLGRIYVAKEGINAQMNVPKENWEQFDAWLQDQPELTGVPYKIAVEEGEMSSFYKLIVRVRPKIVADGLDDTSFDPSNTGAYLTAEEMNELIDDPEAVVVDMRNVYESEIGHFKGAVLPDVETFKEELQVVPKILAPYKARKIGIYCTGGIRCEKASAWLKHQGFENVRHLKGGIIDYAHQVKEKGLPNYFEGKNFVFDERLGERVGEEVISRCHLCRVNKSDTHYHCKNQICHVLFLGCDECVSARGGYCSRFCALIDRLPERTKKLIARYYNRFLKPAQFKKARLKTA